MRLVRNLTPLVVLFVLIGGPASANMGGVSYTSKNFELIKRVGAHRSVIYPDLEESAADVERREGEARTGLGGLGAELDEFIRTLRGAGNPYPLLTNVVLDYRYLRPPEQSPENGRMYIMYTGELRWRFPAPLIADMLRMRVAHAFPQPLKDVLSTALMRWGRDHIEGPSQKSLSMRREETAGWIEDLSAPDIARVSWRHDQVIKNLMLASLDPDHVAALEKLTRTGEVRVRVAALRVLGSGGHLRDPALFVSLLGDKADKVRHAAFWGLVFMTGDRGLVPVQSYAGRAQAIGARLKEVRGGVTVELVTEQVRTFDAAVSAITGQPSVAATPYKIELTPAELLQQVKAAKKAAGESEVEEKVPAPALEGDEEAPERKPVVPESKFPQ